MKRLYQIWYCMKSRCYNPKDCKYKYYGNRGISVCDEWKNDKKLFISWAIDNGYDDNLTIDRINSNGNYCPENCKFSTYTEQNRNRSNVKKILYKGELLTCPEIAEKIGISNNCLHMRIERNGIDLSISDREFGSHVIRRHLSVERKRDSHGRYI